MKKETVNIFQEGLNMDLNPIVTPNNMLVDALNATTLTFNGDELSLQTDAGNTKIKVSGKDEYVKLSDGYYPLGIKEYGGVLYVVSGKSLENNLRTLKENTEYFINDVIWFKGVYFYNNENTTIEEIPEMLDSKWTELGTLDEAKRKFDYIEVGSYPAPEFSDDQNLYGKTTIFSDKDSFYRTYVINDNFFKSGRRIKFTPDTRTVADISNVTTNDDVKFYIVKLLHQLDNGMLDLTEDIWKQFIEHKNETGDTANHWLMSSSFLYYCPTRFKGKLLLQVIFDEPENFRFANRPELSFLDPETPEVATSSHKIVFDLEWENSSNISIDHYNLLITDFDGNPIGDIKKITTRKYTFYIPYKDINPYESYSGISYLITPNFSHEGTFLDPSHLPNEFIEKFKISGTRLLEERYNEIYFILEQSRCSGNNMRDYDIAIISNRNGNIGFDLEPSDTQYIFIREGAAKSEESQKVIGVFDIVDDKPQVVTTEHLQDVEEAKTKFNKIAPNLYAHIETQLESTNLRFHDTSCSEIEIVLKFSSFLPLNSTSEVSSEVGLSFSQPEVERNNIEYNTIDGRSFRIKVNLSSDVLVVFDGKSLFSNSTYPYVIRKEDLDDEAVFQYGLISGFINNTVRLSEDLTTAYMVDESTSTFMSTSIGNNNVELGRSISNDGSLVFSFSGDRHANVSFDSNNYEFMVDVTPGTNSYDFTGMYWVIPYEIVGSTFNKEKYINMQTPAAYIEIGNEQDGFLIFERNGTFITRWTSITVI